MNPFMHEFANVAVIFFLIAGVFFHATACLGILRFPDVYMRISGISMAGTLGNMSYLIAASIYFGTGSVISKAAVIVFFSFITSPISGHILGRAAYLFGVPLWKGSVVNEWEPVLEEEEKKKGPSSQQDKADLQDPDILSTD